MNQTCPGGAKVSAARFYQLPSPQFVHVAFFKNSGSTLFSVSSLGMSIHKCVCV